MGKLDVQSRVTSTPPAPLSSMSAQSNNGMPMPIGRQRGLSRTISMTPVPEERSAIFMLLMTGIDVCCL